MATVHCPRCYSDTVYRSALALLSTSASGVSPVAGYSSLPTAMKPANGGVTEQIVDIAFNGAGVGDHAWTLKIGFNSDIRTLKTFAPAD